MQLSNIAREKLIENWEISILIAGEIEKLHFKIFKNRKRSLVIADKCNK